MRAVLAAMLIFGTMVALAPVADSQHCESRLTIYGRHSFAPAPLTPNHMLDQNACNILKSRGVDGHTLPPNADQIMIRVNGAFGPALASLVVDLDGMGFNDAQLLINRTEEPMGATYQLSEWMFLPDPSAGPLTATVYYPRGASYTVTYAASPTQLPLPPLPAPPLP